MDKLILNGTNGFPLYTDTLAEAQRCWNIFNAITGITGNLAIISGCELRGTTVSDGVVAIDGEVINFKGGAIMPNVIIEEIITQRTFKDGNTKPVFATRTAKFGIATKSYRWADFQRINPLVEMQKAMTPKGLISMWSGKISEIPAGWYLCDGTNGTPNLSGKFVRGFSENEYKTDQSAGVGEYGGHDEVTPSGSLSGNATMNVPADGWSVAGTGLGTAKRGTLIVGSGELEKKEVLESLRVTKGTREATVALNGVKFTGSTQDNRPAFYSLAFIMFKG